jgi:hypothetical protein
MVRCTSTLAVDEHAVVERAQDDPRQAVRLGAGQVDELLLGGREAQEGVNGQDEGQDRQQRQQQPDAYRMQERPGRPGHEPARLPVVNIGS